MTHSAIPPNREVPTPPDGAVEPPAAFPGDGEEGTDEKQEPTRAGEESATVDSRPEAATDLAPQETFLDVSTGEVLPATPSNAAAVIAAARDLKSRCDQAIRDATRILVEESQRQGKKSFAAGDLKVELSGGPKVNYNHVDLTQALRDAGVPEERIAEAVKEEVSYKIDRAVLKQLAGANPAYARAIESVAQTEDDTYKAALK